MTMSRIVMKSEEHFIHTADMSPTWENLEFDQEIPTMLIHGDGKESHNGKTKENCIYGMVMDKRLVYRHFAVKDGSFYELCRYVFFKNSIVKENRDQTSESVTADLLKDLDVKDILFREGAITCEAVYEAFKSEVNITNKPSMLRIMPYIRHDYHKMSFKPFLEVYIKTRVTDAKIEGIPNKIARELYGRNLKPYSTVRIDNNLSVVTGEKRCQYIYLKEQTRLYFDENRPYYFVNNVATGFWQIEDIRQIFEYEQELKNRYIDKGLFRNTCAEKLSERGITSNSLPSSKITYGSLAAQAAFLSADQAAKTDSQLFKLVMDGIYKKQITATDSSLPDIVGITGPQLKYLRTVRLPDNLKDFRECIKDRQFMAQYPDIKKRIFAVSIYLNILVYRYMRNERNTAKKDIIEASQTICSLEKVQGDKRYQLADEYIDYLLMRKNYLGLAENMSEDDPVWQEIKAFGEPPINIKPSKIHDQHNKLGKIIDLMTRKNTIEDYDHIIKKRKEKEASEIEYTNGKYSILMPKDARDIIREGRILHHCVGHGGYIQNMAHKKCRILFLRDNNDLNKPLITIEERNSKIRQCYGFADRINTNAEIRDFIIDFACRRGWEIDAVIYTDNTEPVRPAPLPEVLTQREINALLRGVIE